MWLPPRTSPVTDLPPDAISSAGLGLRRATLFRAEVLSADEGSSLDPEGSFSRGENSTTIVAAVRL